MKQRVNPLAVWIMLLGLMLLAIAVVGFLVGDRASFSLGEIVMMWFIGGFAVTFGIAYFRVKT